MDPPKRPTTRQDYEQRMLRALVHIQEHLDDALCLDELAGVANFSPFHFHRIFRGMVGESVQAHVRRLRLERAAHRLKFTEQRVTHIAFEAGYESHEAFTRVFRTMFDVSPTEFRRLRRDVPQADCPSGVHFLSEGRVERMRSVRAGEEPLAVRIERIDKMNVVFIRHTGPYDQVGETWNRLFGWAGPRGLIGMVPVAVGVVYDDPDITPPERLRYDACLIVHRELAPDGDVGVQTVGGGTYAVTRHEGPYNLLGSTYARLCGVWLPHSSRELRSAPALEFYRNSPLTSKPEELITDIFLPLED